MKLPLLTGRKLSFVLHLAVWFILFILPAYLLYVDSSRDVNFLVRTYIQAICYAVIFYLNYLWLAPKFFFRKRKVIYFSSSSILIVLLTVVMVTMTKVFTPEVQEPGPGIGLLPPLPLTQEKGLFPGPAREAKPPGSGFFEEKDKSFPSKQWPTYNFLLISFLISGFGLGLRFSDKLIQKEKQRKEAEKEKLDSELAFLKSQINPHFLFNTLNSIYSLALIKSEMTPEAVMKLSDIMRFVIQDSHFDKVSLEMEVQYIRYYVELQQLRLNDKVDLRMNIEGEFDSKQIPPMILIPFVENAFKYGTSSHENARINIDIRIQQDSFDFSVSNQIFPGREKNGTFGIGIENTRKRLSLIYPDKHTLSITNTGKVFVVKLNIQLV